MIERKIIKNAIKNYIFENSGFAINENENIIEMGLLNSMDFILFVNFISTFIKVELVPSDLEIRNFCSIEAIMNFLEHQKI